MATAEADIHESFLDLAEIHLRHRTNIRPAIQQLREDPIVFTGLAEEFDRVVDYFNRHNHPTSPTPHPEKTFMPNVLQARAVLRGCYLPTLVGLAHDQSSEYQDHCRETFKEVNELMRRGEAGEKEGSWMFHQGVTDVEKLTSAMMLEVYGLYIKKIYPNLGEQNINLVVALEEILAVHYHDTRLFMAVKEYYTVPEGFSEKLVNHINSLN